VSSTDTLFGSTTNIVCHEGYFFQGTNQTKTVASTISLCNASGVWEEIPVCIKKGRIFKSNLKALENCGFKQWLNVWTPSVTKNVNQWNLYNKIQHSSKKYYHFMLRIKQYFVQTGILLSCPWYYNLFVFSVLILLFNCYWYIKLVKICQFEYVEYCQHESLCNLFVFYVRKRVA
jgi:hypothetical protein